MTSPAQAAESVPLTPADPRPWRDFEALVIAETYRLGSQLRVVKHPQPEAAVINGNWGVRVETGPEEI